MYMHVYLYMYTYVYIYIYILFFFFRSAHFAGPGHLYVLLWLVKCASGQLLQFDTPKSKDTTSARGPREGLGRVLVPRAVLTILGFYNMSKVIMTFLKKCLWLVLEALFLCLDP